MSQKDFRSGQDWVDGSRQQVIVESGEGLKEVCAFMREQLENYKRGDLFFWEHEITREDDIYIIKLRSRNLIPIGERAKFINGFDRRGYGMPLFTGQDLTTPLGG